MIRFLEAEKFTPHGILIEVRVPVALCYHKLALAHERGGIQSYFFMERFAIGMARL